MSRSIVLQTARLSQIFTKNETEHRIISYSEDRPLLSEPHQFIWANLFIDVQITKAKQSTFPNKNTNATGAHYELSIFII